MQAWQPGETALSAAVDPLCSLSLYAGRSSGAVVGRKRELAAVRRALAAAQTGLACSVLEGEPGIGKTRFLLDVDEVAAGEGFISVAVTADEEIRGPFLLARSIFACPSLRDAIRGTPAEDTVARTIDALSIRRDDHLASMTPDQRLLRAFDLAAGALQTVAAIRPLALLLDDIQWSDEDSLRLLRYFVRTSVASHVFLLLALRPNETAEVNEAVTLLADVERTGILQRLRLERFSQLESQAFLEQTLGGPMAPQTAAVMHAQAEGLPFILAEQARAYREAGLVQQVDGAWTLARNAERMLPSAVRTLIQRRAARLPEASHQLLAEAGVLGRGFSLRDLADMRAQLGAGTEDSSALENRLEPAVQAGLLTTHPVTSAADYSFTHESVREWAVGTLTPAQRRAAHGAVVDMLLAGGDPPPASLSMLAGHALAAGRGDLCARVAVDAARLALAANAPEEVLRLVALAQPVAAGVQARVDLLRLRDDALGVLRRSGQRLEGLTELAALAEAMGDATLGLEIMLRRAAALRLSQEHDVAADLAARVRERAASLGLAATELAACLERGQDCLRSELGDASVQTPSEADLDGAEEAFRRAIVLAEAAGAQPELAAALRELGVVLASRVRAWFIGEVEAGLHVQFLQQIVQGKTLNDLLPDLPIAPLVREGVDCYNRALEIYESLGDRRGVMAVVVGLAALTWAPGVHIGGSVRHIEEMRRLAGRVRSFTRESERALADAQMVFGAHVYARARGFADQAIEKGQEAYRAARSLGDLSLEFAAASGTALQHAELGDIESAEEWVAHAAAVASSAPTPFRALQLEIMRGIVRAEANDVTGFRARFDQAVRLATDQARPAAQCETLATFAVHAAWLGERLGEHALLDAAEHAADGVEALAGTLPGHPPWRARAYAARARCQRARGDFDQAAQTARRALEAHHAAFTEGLHLDVLLPVAAALIAGGTEEEAAALRGELQLAGQLVALRIVSEEARTRWFASPVGRALVEVAGPIGDVAVTAGPGVDLGEGELALLRLVTEARSNSEIAAELGTDEATVARRLAELFGKIGAAGRADATTLALTGSLV